VGAVLGPRADTRRSSGAVLTPRAGAQRRRWSLGRALRHISGLPLIPSILALGVALLVWQAAAERAVLPAYVLPMPGKVLAAWLQLLQNGSLWRHLSATLSEAFTGFVVALVVGG